MGGIGSAEGSTNPVDGGTWRHPFADVHEEVVDGWHRRVTTLDPGLGTGDAAQRQTAALNRILTSLAEPRLLPATLVERFEGRLRLISARTEARPVGERLVAGPLPLRMALHVLIQVCDVLETAHELGVIHGALTPASVLLQGEGDAPAVVVTDFGLAHVVSGSDHGRGAPGWHPITPEKLLGERPVAATDVYLIGTLGYGLLTGRPVFNGDTAEVVQRSHSIEEPPSLHGIDSRIPPRLSTILAKCLVKEPEDRFERPAALAQALSEFLGTYSEPVLAGRDEGEPMTMVLSQLPPTPSAPPATSAPDPSAVDEDAATRAMTLRDPLPMPRQPPPAPTPARSWMWLAPVVFVVVLAAIGGGYFLYERFVKTGGDVPESQAAIGESQPERPKSTPAEVTEPEPEDAEPEAVEEKRPTKAKPSADHPSELADGQPIPADDAAQFLEDDGEDGGSTDARARAEAQSLVSRAATARRAGRHDDALAYYSEALELQPGYAPAADGLAGIHLLRGEFGEAVKFGELAIAGAPDNAGYHVRLGDAYSGLGEGDKARVQWERAAELGSAEASKRLEG
jgi:hypothetical protein